jgi:hypothetical protein
MEQSPPLAVPLLGWLIAGLWLWRPGLDPTPVHMGLGGRQSGTGLGLIQVLQLPVVSIIPSFLNTHLFVYRQWYIILAVARIAE